MFLKPWEERQFISILKKMYEAAPNIMEQVLSREDAVLQKKEGVILPKYNDFNPEFAAIKYFKGTIEHIIEVCGAKPELITPLFNLCSETIEDWIMGAEGNASLLHIAALSGDFEVAKTLLAYQVDTAQEMVYLNRKYTVLDCAAFGGNIELMRVLFEKGVPCNFTNAVCSAAYYGRFDIIQFLLDRNEWDKNLNVLGSFIVSEDSTTLRLRSGFPLNLAIARAFENYYEEEAVRKKRIDCMVLLLEHNASSNASDIYLKAPLYIIDRSPKIAPDRVDKYDICMLDLLLISGADPNKPDSQNNSLKKIGGLIRNSVDYWNEKLKDPSFLRKSKDLHGNLITKPYYRRIAEEILENNEYLWRWKHIQKEIPLGFLGGSAKTTSQGLPTIVVFASSSEEYRATDPRP